MNKLLSRLPPSKLLRAQWNVAVGASDALFLPANDRRWGLIISSPLSQNIQNTPQGTVVTAVSTAALGTVCSVNYGTGVTATWLTAGYHLNTGTAPTLQAQLFTGTSTFVLGKLVTDIPMSFNFTTAGPITFRIQTTGAGAGSNCDAFIAATQFSQSDYFTLCFNGPAVLNNGINVYANRDPLVLVRDIIGQAIREEIRVISSGFTYTVGVLEILEEGCGCHD